MKWHIPSEEEKSFATELLREFLVGEFDSIQQHMSGVKSLTRFGHHTRRDMAASILQCVFVYYVLNYMTVTTCQFSVKC